MDLEHRNGSSRNLKHVDVTNYEVHPSNRRRYPSTCSLESSQELFVIDMDVLNIVRKSKEDVPEQQGSPISSPEVAGQSPAESSLGGSSSSAAAHSSETTMMTPPRGYDPNRIPASVFANKPANGTDWSVVSNESLFSLRIGTGSFSRENFLMLYKSGELCKLEDQIKPVKPEESITLSKPDERNHFQPSLPPTTKGENMDKISSEGMEKGSNVADAPKAAQDHCQEQSPPAPEDVRVSHRSEGSANSAKSFAFPLLEEQHDYRNKSIDLYIAKTDLEKQFSRNEPQELQQPQEVSAVKEMQQPQQVSAVKEMQQPQQVSAVKETQQPQTTPKTTTKAAGSRWFSCFSRFSICQSGGR